MKLRIADDLTLPVDVVTQTLAILAKRRAGKSYTMRRLVEQLVRAGQQVVLVDPKGDQWGVRSAADGKAPGLPIVILGGERADVPLEASAGEVVAKLVVEERVSALLDLSLFRKHEVATFVTGFLESLYRLKAREQFRTPLMLVIDEADAIAPQKPQKGEERMLGAAEDIVRRGGQRGIGCTLVTQRSAVLNKNVLTQAQILVVLRTIAPQDLVAMKAWIDVHGTDEEGAELMDSLPSLPIGDAWFWSPGWPTVDGIFQRVHVLPIETFDSGATPRPGEKRTEPKTVADVDLEALKRQMSATIEKAKADDPRELRKQIAELKRQITPNSQLPTPKIETRTVERFVLKDGQLARAEKIVESASRLVAKFEDLSHEFGETVLAASLRDTVSQITGAIRQTQTSPTTQRTTEERPSPHARRVGPALPQPTGRRPARVVPPVSSNGDGVLKDPEQRILDSLAWWESAGVTQPTRHQVAFVARYTVNGHFNNILGGLRGRGLVDYPAGDCAALTAAGRGLAHAPEDAPSRDDLIQRVLAVLRQEPQRRIFTAVVEAGAALSREDLADRTNYTVNGHFNNTLGALRSLGVVDYPRGNYVGLSEIFEALT